MATAYLSHYLAYGFALSEQNRDLMIDNKSAREIKILLTEDTQLAITKLSEVIATSLPKHLDFVIHFQSRLNWLEKQSIMGLLDSNSFEYSNNKIRHDIINFVNMMVKKNSSEICSLDKMDQLVVCEKCLNRGVIISNKNTIFGVLVSSSICKNCRNGSIRK